jgi:hypothetical protein
MGIPTKLINASVKRIRRVVEKGLGGKSVKEIDLIDNPVDAILISDRVRTRGGESGTDVDRVTRILIDHLLPSGKELLVKTGDLLTIVDGQGVEYTDIEVTGAIHIKLRRISHLALTLEGMNYGG